MGCFSKRVLVLLLLFVLMLPFFISKSGNVMVAQAEEDEFHAVWITYLEFLGIDYSERGFKKHIDTMFDEVRKMGMNAVVVHVRPFSDAFYPSKYYPWSRYVSGAQGKDPGYDPLAYMVSAAHERGLQFHAWVNPYRITSNSTDIKALAKNHPARKYLEDKNKANERYVLSYGGRLYFNPAYAAVRTLIVNGVKEIAENYDVDGIHFDDYFYPELGKDYQKLFDAPEYEAYKEAQAKAGEPVRDIVNWRKWQVNSLVYRIYGIVKKTDKDVKFGISPEGYMKRLLADDKHYTDLKTWFTKKGYIDYICPQIYFSFEHKTAAFDKMLDEWIEYMGDTKVRLYIGIPVYKVGAKDTNIEDQFRTDDKLLQNMVELCRESGKVTGFVYYRYENLISKAAAKAMKNLLEIIP